MRGVGRPAVFLDRDGTLNERPAAHSYVTSADGFRWLEGAQEAIEALARAGFTVVVVSNQRGVARGLVSERTLSEIEERIQTDLAARGCRIEAFRYCPHDTGEGCACRKPAPGLLLDLASELHLDLSLSWMIGDSISDVLAGRAAGCRTLLVGDTRRSTPADLVAGSLREGAQLVASTLVAA